jgi:hypothetical protein
MLNILWSSSLFEVGDQTLMLPEIVRSFNILSTLGELLTSITLYINETSKTKGNPR